MGVAPFADLLSVSAHSPAMLAYLDQEKSYASKLNENYAREIMELHTLGVHGGYKQIDVTALAGVLNGWTTAHRGHPAAGTTSPSASPTTALETRRAFAKDFRFDPYLNDGKERRGVRDWRSLASKDPAVRYDQHPAGDGDARRAPEHR